LDANQRVFTEIVRDHRERIVYLDEYARQVYLPLTREHLLLVDPYRRFGRPLIWVDRNPRRCRAGPSRSRRTDRVGRPGP